MKFNEFFSELVKRRLWSSIVGYPATAFIILQAIDFFIIKYDWNEKLLTTSLILLLGGFPISVAWNWLHGEKGKQNTTNGELITYLNIGLITIATTFFYWFYIGVDKLNNPATDSKYILQEEKDIAQTIEGFWIYELRNFSTQDYIFGVFEIVNELGRLSVKNGISFYAKKENGKFVERGKWKSRAVLVQGNDLFIIFYMNSTSQKPVAGDAREYSGIVEFSIISNSVLDGIFHDLGIRHENWGTVTASKSSKETLIEVIEEAKFKQN